MACPCPFQNSLHEVLESLTDPLETKVSLQECRHVRAMNMSINKHTNWTMQLATGTHMHLACASQHGHLAKMSKLCVRSILLVVVHLKVHAHDHGCVDGLASAQPSRPSLKVSKDMCSKMP